MAEATGFPPSADGRPQETSISPAQDEDTEALLELMREFYVGERLPYREDIARSCLETLRDHPSLGVVYLLRTEGALIGYAVLSFGFSFEFFGRDALVDELYVRQPYRRGGHGTACLSELERICVAEGIRAMHLEVDHDNPEAQRLYRRSGYLDHARHLMTKWLSGSENGDGQAGPREESSYDLQQRRNDGGRAV